MVSIVIVVILISRVVVAMVLIVALVILFVVFVVIILGLRLLIVLLLVIYRIDVLLVLIFRYFWLGYAWPRLNNFLRLIKVCVHSTIGTPHKVTLFVIKYIAFILGKHSTLSIINDVITLELNFCEILVHLIFSQLLRVPFNEVGLVEVLVFALVMDYF